MASVPSAGIVRNKTSIGQRTPLFTKINPLHDSTTYGCYPADCTRPEAVRVGSQVARYVLLYSEAYAVSSDSGEYSAAEVQYSTNTPDEFLHFEVTTAAN